MDKLSRTEGKLILSLISDRIDTVRQLLTLAMYEDDLDLQEELELLVKIYNKDFYSLK